MLAAAAADPSAAVVVYKGGGRLPELALLLAEAGRLDGAVLGELLGLPGGRMAPVREVADRPASYLATVVVPPVRPQRSAAGDGPEHPGGPSGPSEREAQGPVRRRQAAS